MREFIIKLFKEFILYESTSSLLLLLASIIALLWANSAFSSSYFSFFKAPISLDFLHYATTTSLDHVINDGLMTIFFLLVTLEVKREWLIGELNTRAKALLPIMAAVGGMLFPAIIYLLINHHHVNALPGWAVPTATDIAFSLAIITLLKRFIPGSLKSLLTALAIIDDLGAIIIIALFYTQHLSVLFLLLAIISWIILVMSNLAGVSRYSIYFIVGLFLWVFILKSGVHSTIAGVLLGSVIPLTNNKDYSPLKRLEHKLHPWVAFGILPLFALANTGVSLADINQASLFHNITLGIIFGLVLGKQLGVFFFCWLSQKLKIARLPNGVTWHHLWGLSILCGIGFTMSLFIGDLAFPNNPHFEELVKIGVLSGSILSGLLGYLVIRLGKRD